MGQHTRKWCTGSLRTRTFRQGLASSSSGMSTGVLRRSISSCRYLKRAILCSTAYAVSLRVSGPPILRCDGVKWIWEMLHVSHCSVIAASRVKTSMCSGMRARSIDG